jgi:hypothetical protein
MAIPQTSYSETIRPAVAGMVANQRTYDAITRTCEVEAGIGFGLAVAQGTADAEKGCVLGGALPIFLGVSMKDVTTDSDPVDEYSEHDNVAILTQGEIWVQVTGTPTPASAVHYNATTGVFATSGGTGPILGARWTSQVVTGGLCRLKLGDRPQNAA